jgi:hypothetical protein
MTLNDVIKFFYNEIILMYRVILSYELQWRVPG